MTVLVVDDNVTLLKNLVKSLTLAKYEALGATSIKQASDLLKYYMPQVICLDIHLPDGNGLDFLATLRQAGFQVPAILMSSKLLPEGKERRTELESVNYLTKPFPLSAFGEMLEEVMGKDNRESFSTSQNQPEETPHSENADIEKNGPLSPLSAQSKRTSILISCESQSYLSPNTTIGTRPPDQFEVEPPPCILLETSPS